VDCRWHSAVAVSRVTFQCEGYVEVARILLALHKQHAITILRVCVAAQALAASSGRTWPLCCATAELVRGVALYCGHVCGVCCAGLLVQRWGGWQLNAI
jgi:hypothetical protein